MNRTATAVLTFAHKGEGSAPYERHACGSTRTFRARAMMKLTEEEEAMRAGELDPAARWAIEHQIKVGDYLGAGDFVPVTQAHVMADTESLGVAGVEWLERLARQTTGRRRLRIPTITDPRGTDFAAAQRLKQQPWMLELE